MSYVRANVKVVIDNPHCDGLVKKYGIGVNWEATDYATTLTSGKITPDIGTNYGWYLEPDFEYLGDSRSIGPRGTIQRTDMNLSDWIQTGDWRLGEKSGLFDVRLLHCYTASPARITAKDVLGPNVDISIWRGGKPNGSNVLPVVGIDFLDEAGNRYTALIPAKGQGGQWWNELTGLDSNSELDHPVLLARAPGQKAVVLSAASAQKSLDWSLVGQVGGIYQIIHVRYEVGMLIVSFGGHDTSRDSTLMFSGSWIDEERKHHSFSIYTFDSVWCLGHQIMVGVWPVQYKSEAVLKPRTRIFIPDACNFNSTVPVVIKDEPPGTSIEVQIDNNENDKSTAPIATFNSTGSFRPTLVRICQVFPTVWEAGTSNPRSTGNRHIVSASGEINKDWKGSTCKLTFVSTIGTPVYPIPVGSKMIVDVGATGGTYWRQFTGYASSPEFSKPERVLAARVTTECVDLIDARLRRKSAGWLPVFDGWPLAEAWTTVLDLFTVPSALIDTSQIPAGLSLPYTVGAEPQFKFKPDAEAVSVLDTIANAMGLEWGVGVDGRIFLRRPLTYSGTPDIDLEDHPVEDAKIITNIRSVFSFSEFRNFLEVIAGSGENAVAKTYIDVSSYSDPESPTFIGDFLPRYIMTQNGNDIDRIAAKLWREAKSWHVTVEFTLHDLPQIIPGHYIRGHWYNIGLPNNVILRVIGKSWEIDLATGRYTQRITAVKEA